MLARVGSQFQTTGVGPEGMYLVRNGSIGYADPAVNPGNVPGDTGFAGLQAFTFVSLIRRTNANATNLQCAVRYRLSGNVNSNELNISLSPYNQNNVISFKGPVNTQNYTLGGASARADTVFVAGVWDRTNNDQRLHVNGAMVAQRTAGTNQISTDAGLTLYHADAGGGSINTGFLPYGTYVYRRALSEEEIRSLYNGFWQIFSEVPSDEEEYFYSRATKPEHPLLYLSGAGLSSVAPGPDAKPLVLHLDSIRERSGTEGDLLVMEGGVLRTVKL